MEEAGYGREGAVSNGVAMNKPNCCEKCGTYTGVSGENLVHGCSNAACECHTEKVSHTPCCNSCYDYLGPCIQENCPCHKPHTPESWEEKYDSIVNDFDEPEFDWEKSDALQKHMVKMARELKPFIHSLLAAERSTLREKIEGMKRYTRDMDSTLHNRTLDDVLSLLKED